MGRSHGCHTVSDSQIIPICRKANWRTLANMIDRRNNADGVMAMLLGSGGDAPSNDDASVSLDLSVFRDLASVLLIRDWLSEYDFTYRMYIQCEQISHPFRIEITNAVVTFAFSSYVDASFFKIRWSGSHDLTAAA